MATYNTDRALYSQAKAGHIGTQCVDFTHTSTAAGSVGDVINVCKVPKGAKFESLELFGACVGTLLTFEVGDAGSSTRHGTLSLTATSTYKEPTAPKVGFKFESLSDSNNANDWLFKLTVATATSVSGGWSFSGQLRYHLD
jgi:hypothetical protein